MKVPSKLSLSIRAANCGERKWAITSAISGISPKLLSTISARCHEFGMKIEYAKIMSIQNDAICGICA